MLAFAESGQQQVEDALGPLEQRCGNALAAWEQGKTPPLLTGHDWAVLAIYLAIAHQVITAVGFRLQLHQNLLTEKFGDRDMRVWGAIFLPLLAVRPIILCVVGWTDTGAITGWRWSAWQSGACIR